MASFTIPSIFTAIDKMSPVIRRMKNGVQDFATKAGGALERNERLFRKLTPALSSAQKQLLDMASAAAIAGAALGLIHFSADSVMKYEDAVSAFHVILGNDKPIKAYEKEINRVAAVTKKSSVETAQAFEKIAALNADFADTSDSIGMVSQAAITLSKASGEDLAGSAESLVGIMNQFSFGADKAQKTINVLAAGAGVGAASIAQTSEAFVNFGSVASGANITLEQSVGLIQTLGKFSVFGAEAGTKLRGSILKIQKAGIGYKSGQFQINDALTEAKAKIDKLRTAKEKDAAVLKIFGAENIATGKILLENIGVYEKFASAVQSKNQAEEQAAIRSNTLSTAIDELKAAWVNMITGSNGTSGALEKVKEVIRDIATNLPTIVKWGMRIIGFFVAWKAILIVTRIAMIAYDIAMGIGAVTSASLAVGVTSTTAAVTAQNIATKAIIAAQWLWNAAMSANPIFLIIAGVAALGLGIYGLVKAFNQKTAAEQAGEDVRERALENTVDQRVEITQLFMALRSAKQGSEAYAGILKQINQIQPGIVEKYNLQAKSLAKISEAEKELTRNIMKRAEAEAAAELLKEAVREKIVMQNEGPSFSDKLTGATTAFTAEQLFAARLSESDKKINALAVIMQQKQKELSTPTADNQAAMTSSLLEKTNNAKVDIVVNDPAGKLKVDSKSPNTKIKTTSTMSMQQN